jgi:hypothetical protein
VQDATVNLRTFYVYGGITVKRLTVTQKRWMLSAHILCTIAWLGPAFCYLVVAILAATTLDPSLVKAAYTVFGLLEHTLVLGAAAGTAVTGVLLSVMTNWGLTRWYWIIVKAIATPLVIMLELFALESLLQQAMGGGVPHNQLIGGFAGHLATMSAIVVISVLKPWGQRSAVR